VCCAPSRGDRLGQHPDALVQVDQVDLVQHAGRREAAAGAYRASARKDSISMSTELIQPVSARSSSQARSAADSGSA